MLETWRIYFKQSWRWKVERKSRNLSQRIKDSANCCVINSGFQEVDRKTIEVCLRTYQEHPQLSHHHSPLVLPLTQTTDTGILWYHARIWCSTHHHNGLMDGVYVTFTFPDKRYFTLYSGSRLTLPSLCCVLLYLMIYFQENISSP